MKNLIKSILFVSLFSILASCGSSKQVVQRPVPQEPPSKRFGPTVEMPCIASSYDDSEFFRELGIGTNMNPQNARTAAFQSAKSLILERLGGFVQGLNTDYKRTFAGQSGENTQRAMEGELSTLVEGMINDAGKICEELTQDQNGAYHSFIVLEIPKKELVDNMINSLSKNEELETEFGRQQYRNFAEEKMEKMKEAQKNRKNEK